MTATLNETTSKASSGLPGIGLALGERALASGAVSWLAGVGLQSGYHVSVPFVGTWVAVFAGFWAIAHGAKGAADGFHLSKVNATGLLKQAENAGLAALMAKLGSAGK